MEGISIETQKGIGFKEYRYYELPEGKCLAVIPKENSEDDEEHAFLFENKDDMEVHMNQPNEGE